MPRRGEGTELSRLARWDSPSPEDSASPFFRLKPGFRRCRRDTGAVTATPVAVVATPGAVTATRGAVVATASAVTATASAVTATPIAVVATPGAVIATSGAVIATASAVTPTPITLVTTPSAAVSTPAAVVATQRWRHAILRIGMTRQTISCYLPRRHDAPPGERARAALHRRLVSLARVATPPRKISS
jgi:hypothetical protein